MYTNKYPLPVRFQRSVKMKKIVILGCENSHANAFLKLISEREEFSDISCIGVYSNEPEAAKKLSDQFSVPVLNSFDEAMGKADGVVITARHGDNHYKYAKPYIKSGVPMFIDKPITISEDEAVMFMKELIANKVRVTGGSSLRQDAFIKQLKKESEEEFEGKTIGGIIRAPLSSNSPYGGFYFYAQHLVEMVCEVFGRYPKSVIASKNGDVTTVIFKYEAYDAVGVFTENNYLYYAERFSEKGVHGAPVASTQGNDWYYMEFKEYAEILRGKEQSMSYTDLIAPVFIMNAIEKAIKSGKEETVCLLFKQ